MSSRRPNSMRLGRPRKSRLATPHLRSYVQGARQCHHFHSTRTNLMISCRCPCPSPSVKTEEDDGSVRTCHRFWLALPPWTSRTARRCTWTRGKALGAANVSSCDGSAFFLFLLPREYIWSFCFTHPIIHLDLLFHIHAPLPISCHPFPFFSFAPVSRLSSCHICILVYSPLTTWIRLHVLIIFPSPWAPHSLWTPTPRVACTGKPSGLGLSIEMYVSHEAVIFRCNSCILCQFLEWGHISIVPASGVKTGMILEIGACPSASVREQGSLTPYSTYNSLHGVPACACTPTSTHATHVFFPSPSCS